MLQVFEKNNLPDLEQVYRLYHGSLQSKNAYSFYDGLQYFFNQDQAAMAIWCSEQTYISALRWEIYMDGFLLSCLETVPEYRRKGHATALLQAVVEEMSRMRKGPLYAHVHKKNLGSLVIHQRCGFQKYLDYGRLLDGTVSSQYVTLQRNIK